jgi:hypothetical protein
VRCRRESSRRLRRFLRVGIGLTMLWPVVLRLWQSTPRYCNRPAPAYVSSAPMALNPLCRPAMDTMRSRLSRISQSPAAPSL